MARALPIISCVLIAGCGRVAFDDVSVTATDAPVGDVALRPCDPMTPFGPAVPVAGLDMAAVAAVARLSLDEREIFFQSVVGNVWQLFRATRADRTSAFGPWEQLAFNVATAHSYDGMLEDDLQTLVFASTRTGGTGGIDLWRVSRPDPMSGFGSPSPIAPVNSGTNEDQPYVPRPHDLLWYVSIAGGTEDIYNAAWNGTEFAGGAPVVSLDGPSSETFPVPSDDGLVVYFGSDRNGTIRIFVGTRAATSASFNVSEVTELFDGQQNQPSWLSPDLCRLYFSRGDLGGGIDVHAMMAERQPP